MANANTSALVLSSGSMEQTHMSMKNISLSQQPIQQIHNRSDGNIAILWDIENCPVPSDVRAEDVAGNIRMALRVHPVIKGAVTVFSAYGDFNAFPRRLREGCQRTGVKLVDVPNGRKDAADKAILIDMFLFALDNPPSSSIMLISGDVDFAPALHILGQRGYTMILVLPSGVGVNSALSNAGRFVWDWLSVVRGEGFVPPSRSIAPPRGGQTEISGFLMGGQINDNTDGQNEEEAIVYRGASQRCYNFYDFSMVSQSLSEYGTSTSMPSFPGTSRSYSLPSGLNEVLAQPASSHDQSDFMWVQPGDINGLKGQLVKLLEMSGGCMPLARVPAEYQKTFGRPLYVSEYGSLKLAHLFIKMADKISIDGKGQKKFVYLRNFRAEPTGCVPQLGITKNDKKGKGIREENCDAGQANGSSEELSDDDRVVIEAQDERDGGVKDMIINENLKHFKCELQEILVSFYCPIFLDCFEDIYQRRYKKPLDCRRFGVNEVEELFEKLSDVVVVQGDPVSKKKLVVAIGHQSNAHADGLPGKCSALSRVALVLFGSNYHAGLLSDLHIDFPFLRSPQMFLPLLIPDPQASRLRYNVGPSILYFLGISCLEGCMLGCASTQFTLPVCANCFVTRASAATIT